VTTLRFILTGVGNIGRTLLEVLEARRDRLQRRYGLRLTLVGVADASGAAADPDGIDVGAVVALKRQRRSVAELPGIGRRGESALELLERTSADLLLEATPTNPRDGQPGLALVRAALRRGMAAVLASKGPLTVAYGELAGLSDLAEQAGPAAPCLRFSGAVGGALPSINLGWRDLAGGEITRVEAVLNGTTQMILGLRARGMSAADALAEAQRVGIAEPDATLDVDGWDAACKLVILANAVLRRRVGLDAVRVRGIGEVDDASLHAAAAAGGRVSLLAVAEAQADGDYALSVAPTALAGDHPLARLGLDELGIVYHSDIAGRTTATSLEDGPVGTVAAMLRDVIEVAGRVRVSGGS
jgi:homoserine dehydrogenase